MATPTQLRDAEAWFAQYERATRELDARTVAAVRAAYEDLEDWFNPTLTLAAAATAASSARSAQQMQAGLVVEFVAMFVEIFTGRRPTIVRRAAEYPRNAEPFDVYSRPIFDYRHQIRAQGTPEAAMEAAESRAEVISLTDALLTRRSESRAVLEAAGVERYRRVIRPELSETGTCGLCIAAASRVYQVRELLPIHSRCKCEVLPIVGADDPGERFNRADLQALYEATPGTTKRDLAKTRYRVTDDAELGPVLAPAA